MALVVTWLGFSVCVVFLCVMCVVDGSLIPSTSVAKIRVNTLKHCQEFPGLNTTFDDLLFFPGPEENEMMYADGRLTIGTEIPSDTILRVDYRKCVTRDEESCEKYLATDLRNVCKHLVDETKSWSHFIKQIQGFNPKCPLQPGTYSIEEAPVDMSPFENMTDFVGHWQLELSFIAHEKVLGCILADIEVYLQQRKEKS